MNTDYQQKLIQEIITQTDSNSGHPDPSIRKFYKAVMACYQPGTQLYRVINSTITSRPSITPIHLATLLPRAAQYALRKNNITDYTTYNIKTWKNVISDLIASSPDFNYALNNFNNSATRPQSRYRALAAIAAAISAHSHDGLIIHDWGCSLNMGLAGLLTRKFYANEISRPISDHTPNQTIQKWIEHDNLNITKGIGVDIVMPDVDWIHACEYFINYDKRTKFFHSIKNPLLNKSLPLQFISADISNEILPHLSPINQLSKSPNRQIIYMSMVLYQLSLQNRKQAFTNALQILNDQDILITLDYVNSAIRFAGQNIKVNIYIKKNNQFSRAYEWIKWTDATCQEAFPGVDFELTNQLLNIQ